MTESAYYIFKRPTFIDKGEPFLEAVLGIPGAGHYTPNLAQEINLSRIQRRINVDRVSIRKGYPWLQVSATNESRRLGGNNSEGTPRWGAVMRTLLVPFTNADSYSRCFKDLIWIDTTSIDALSAIFTVWWGCAMRGYSRRFSVVIVIGRVDHERYQPSDKVTCQSGELDRNIKAEQGGCLYEQPVSQI